MFVVILAFVGVLSRMPQHCEDVRDHDSLGSGLRLLPLIGGDMVGALPAAQTVRWSARRARRRRLGRELASVNYR